MQLCASQSHIFCPGALHEHQPPKKAHPNILYKPISHTALTPLTMHTLTAASWHVNTLPPMHLLKISPPRKLMLAPGQVMQQSLLSASQCCQWVCHLSGCLGSESPPQHIPSAQQSSTHEDDARCMQPLAKAWLSSRPPHLCLHGHCSSSKPTGRPTWLSGCTTSTVTLTGLGEMGGRSTSGGGIAVASRVACASCALCATCCMRRYQCLWTHHRADQHGHETASGLLQSSSCIPHLVTK